MAMFRNALARLKGADMSPAGVLKTFQGWVAYRGGTMDHMMNTAETPPRPDDPADHDQWGWRTPAPGSQSVADVPYRNPEEVYDIKYYSRDTRRNVGAMTVAEGDFSMLEAEERKLLEARKAAGEDGDAEDAPVNRGSAGNGNPDVYRYSKDGLRNTMTATHDALAASLDRNVQTQNPIPEWAEEGDKIVADYKAKGLPAVPGRRFAVPHIRHRHDPRW